MVPRARKATASAIEIGAEGSSRHGGRQFGPSHTARCITREISTDRTVSSTPSAKRSATGQTQLSLRSSSGPASPRTDLVTAPNFLLATRESGYKSSSLAVAELIDNSIQAAATTVDVSINRTGSTEHPLEILVSDDGEGMDALTLAAALSFGGSTRFGDRRSLGRYGMGLPNGGLSRARRIEVFSWRGDPVLHACLDIDDLIRSRRRSLPRVRIVPRPDFVPHSKHGTTVVLTRCDRLEYRRASSLARRLKEDLGRIYRHFLDDGLVLRLNGETISAADPLCLSVGASQFGETLEYRVLGPQGEGTVKVLFAELPIEQWHGLGADEKRRRGVTGAPAVSIVRADREVDRGWFFMGSKRRENYDDWWRCEIRFDPRLDEHFGITNAKQAIRPSSELRAVLEPDLEAVGRALNRRARRCFELLKVGRSGSAAVSQASKAFPRLPNLPTEYRPISQAPRISSISALAGVTPSPLHTRSSSASSRAPTRSTSRSWTPDSASCLIAAIPCTETYTNRSLVASRSPTEM